MSIVKKLSLITLNIFLFALAGFSQQPNYPGMRDSSMRGGMNRDSALRNMPAICKVIGTLQDSLTKSGLEFTSVAVLKVRDSSIVGGTLTNGKGQFSIEALQPGKYSLLGRWKRKGFAFDDELYSTIPQRASNQDFYGRPG